MPYNAKDLQTRFQALDLPNGVTVGVNEDGLASTLPPGRPGR